jgi:hypothetical protein
MMEKTARNEEQPGREGTLIEEHDSFGAREENTCVNDIFVNGIPKYLQRHAFCS